MNITPDFSQALESSPIPPGVYKARVTGAEQKTSKKGAPMVNWKLTIFGAEGEVSKQNNRPVFLTTMLSGPGSGILRDFTKAVLGAVPTEWQPGWHEQYLGREIEITVAERRQEDGSVSNFPDVKAVRAIR